MSPFGAQNHPFVHSEIHTRNPGVEEAVPVDVHCDEGHEVVVLAALVSLQFLTPPLPCCSLISDRQGLEIDALLKSR